MDSRSGGANMERTSPTRYTVLELDPLPEVQELAIRAKLDPQRYFLIAGGTLDTGERLAAVSEADFLIVWGADVDASVLRAGRKLRLVQKYKIAHGFVDFETAQELGIPIVEVPCLALHSVAEFTVMLMLVLLKRFPQVCHDMRKQPWLSVLKPRLTTQKEYAYNWIKLTGFDTLYRKTVGLVGLGTIGQQVARLLRPFETRTLYTKRHPLEPAEEKDLGVEYVGLEELLQRSDIVSLHLTFHEGSENLIGERELGMMKPTAFLVNTSRGRVLDEGALYRALSSGRLAGAALDVFQMEPLPSDSPLWHLDNLIITPHVAGIPSAVGAEIEAALIAANIAKHSS